MAGKLGILGGVLQNELDSWKKDLFSEDSGKEEEKQMDPKQKKEEEKRLKAIQQFQEEKRKKREKEEYKREKMREGIREKYGLPSKSENKANPPQDVRKEYDLTEEEFREYQDQIKADQELKMKSKEKIEKKLEHRRQKKEMKANVKEKCKVQ